MMIPDVIADLRAEIAAERERVDRMLDGWLAATNQLTATVEALKECHKAKAELVDDCARLRDEIDKLKAELKAARHGRQQAEADVEQLRVQVRSLAKDREALNTRMQGVRNGS